MDQQVRPGQSTSRSRTRLIGFAIAGAGSLIALGSLLQAVRPFSSSAERMAWRISALPVGEARVLEFEHHQSITHPDEVTIARLQFSSSAFASLVSAAREKSYVWVTPEDTNAATIQQVVGSPERVLYRVRGSIENAQFDLVVLVPSRKEMVIRSVQH